MEKIVAVVTCDIFQSQGYASDQRRRIDSILKREFTKVSRAYEGAIQTPTSFNVTVGDEFQFVLAKPAKAYEITVFYRVLASLTGLTPVLTFRAAIGIGEIAVESKKDSYAQDGRAFHRARTGMNSLKEQKWKGKRRTTLVTGQPFLDDTLDSILLYQDLLEQKWTQAQREAIRWRFALTTYEEIARRLGVAYQNVQKRLKAANWDEFNHGLEFVERALTAHLQKGA
jgi:hypothetical protein